MNAKQKSVLENPAAGWSDPNGGEARNTRADRLSWEKEVRSGLADKAKSFVGDLSCRLEKLRLLLEQAEALSLSRPGQDLVARERRRLIEALEPELRRWKSLLAGCSAWVGCGAKALDRTLQAAEAAETAAEAPVADLEVARQTIGRLATAAGVKEAVDLSAMDKVLRGRLESAREAAAMARQERDENAAEIVRIEKELAALARRAA